MNMNVFNNLSYGVYIITTLDGDRPTGCTANCAMQITNMPSTIAISINHDNFTNQCIEKTGKFAISILSVNSDPKMIGTFGFQSGKEIDKFEHTEYELVDGIPVIKDSCGYIICNVINKMETDTHTVFLGEVILGEVFEGMGDPMTYAYYHSELKGKSSKNAPTYVPEEENKKTSGTKYVCQVCKYVYEGDELPPDFICPICGKGADKFTKIES